MNLIIDIGNSSTKLALFNGSIKIASFRTRHYSCGKIAQLLSPYTVEKAIISSVRDIPDFIFDLLTVDIPYTHLLTYNSKFPFKIKYETPETLGPDRIAAIAGAWLHYPGKKVLVIDAGSAVTYDYLTGGVYPGGDISPGLAMRFRALHRFTGRLLLASTTKAYNSPGKNTLEEITAGVINGLVYEINEYISKFEEKYRETAVILTGGDSGYLKERLSHEVSYMPDLVIEGLNNLLEYNADHI